MPVPLWWRTRAELLPFGTLARLRQRAARATCVIVALAVWPAVLAAAGLAVTFAARAPSLAAGLGAVVVVAGLGHRRVTGLALALLWPRVRTWEVSSRDGRLVAEIEAIGPLWTGGRGVAHERGRAIALDTGAPPVAEVEAAGPSAVAEAVDRGLRGRGLPAARAIAAEDALVLAAIARLVETGAIEVAADEVRTWRRDGLPPRLAWDRAAAPCVVVRRGHGGVVAGSLEAAVLADLERQLDALGEGHAIGPMPPLPFRGNGSQAPRVRLALTPRLVPALAERRRRTATPGASASAVARRLLAVRDAQPTLVDAALAAAAPLRRALLPLPGSRGSIRAAEASRAEWAA